MKRQNIRSLSLVVITLTYLIIGAAVFDYVESGNEKKQRTLLNEKNEIFMRNFKMNASEFDKLWKLVNNRRSLNAGPQWRFIGSLYFCTVVVTLIGYGHSTPRTVPGKIFCILYSLIGIPIALIMFQSVGERLNSLIAFILGKIKRKLGLKNQDVGLFDLISVEFALTITITCAACYIFVRYERWSYLESLYYCFITLTTIGFGDMVPMQENGTLNQNIPYACFTIFYILTGLTTLASSMNLLVLRLATINAEEQVQEKLEAAEAQRQAVHLDGDVISPNTRLLVTQEKPEQYDKISVCSCTCLDRRLLNFERKSKTGCRRKPSKVKRLFRCNKSERDADDDELVSHHNHFNHIRNSHATDAKSMPYSNSKVSLPMHVHMQANNVSQTTINIDKFLKRNSI